MALFTHMRSGRWTVLHALAAATLAGCATTQPDQSAGPAPDPNAVEIIQVVKEEPSAIRGGGMIYELFVGTEFNARFNDQSRTLTLTDLQGTTCQYDEQGMLTIPEGADTGYVDHCTALSASTIQTLDQ